MSEPAEVVINGVDRTNYLAEGASLSTNARYTLELGQRGEATVSLVVPDGDSYAPVVGQPISLYDFGVRKVGGLIASIREQWYESDNNRVYEITIASFERFLDKFEIPVVAYSGMTAGDIVTALFNLVAAAETITLGTIQAGPTIPFMVFDHDRLTDVFDNLAVTAGFVWFVEPGFETLEFKVQTAVPAPWTLVDDGLAGTFQWTKNNQDFRDRQRIRINYDAFPPEVDVFVGDGVTTTATLSKIPAQVLAVVNTTSTQDTTQVTFIGNPSNGETFVITDTIDGYAITYTFVTILDNTIEFEVLIGATAADTADNLCSAINGDPDIAFQGVIYSWPTYTNGRMRAYPDNPAPAQFLLKSKMPGGNGNAVICGSFSPAITVGAPDDGGSDGVNTSLAIGRLAVDTQKDAYWDYGSTTITFPAAPAAAQSFYVTYYPLGSDVLTVEDSFLKSQRAIIEGGTGTYEEIQDRANTNDPISSNPSAGIQQAREMLSAYKTLPEGLTFSTYRTGLAPGQLLTIALAVDDPFGDVLNGDWLIRQVDAEYTPGYQWKYTIQAIAQSSSPPDSIPRIAAPIQTWEKFVDLGPRRRTGINTGIAASSGVPGAVTFSIKRESYAELTARDVSVATPSSIRQIDFLAPAIKEKDAGWFAHQGTMDAISDPIVVDIDDNAMIGPSRLGDSFTVGSWIIWPSSGEIDLITEITHSAGKYHFTLQRHDPSDADSTNAWFGSKKSSVSNGNFWWLGKEVPTSTTRTNVFGTVPPASPSGLPEIYHFALPSYTLAAVAAQASGDSGNGPVGSTNLSHLLDTTPAPGMRLSNGRSYTLGNFHDSPLVVGSASLAREQVSCWEAPRVITAYLKTAPTGTDAIDDKAMIVWVVYISPDGSTAALLDSLSFGDGSKYSYPLDGSIETRQMPYHEALTSGRGWKAPTVLNGLDWPPSILPKINNAFDADGNLQYIHTGGVGDTTVDTGDGTNGSFTIFSQYGWIDFIVIQVGSSVAGSGLIVSVKT